MFYVDGIILIITTFRVNPLEGMDGKAVRQIREIARHAGHAVIGIFVDGRIATSSVGRLEQNGKRSSGPVSLKHFLHLIICAYIPNTISSYICLPATNNAHPVYMQ